MLQKKRPNYYNRVDENEARSSIKESICIENREDTFLLLFFFLLFPEIVIGFRDINQL